MIYQWKPYFDALLLVLLIFSSIGFGYHVGRKSKTDEPLVSLPKRGPGPAGDEMDELEEAYINEGDFQ